MFINFEFKCKSITMDIGPRLMLCSDLKTLFSKPFPISVVVLLFFFLNRYLRTLFTGGIHSEIASPIW